MFVAINNTDNLNDIDKWIKNTRDASVDKTISPEFAMEVLSKTNHLGHIKKVLKNIKDKCTTPEKMAPYRDFILSCVDRREMSEQAMKMLQEMATLCGCEDSLMSANKKPKLYNKTDYGVVTVKSKEGIKLLVGEDIKVFFDADMVDLSYCDLSQIREIKFGDEAYLDLKNTINLPEVMDFSMSSSLSICNANFEGVKEVKFRDGANVVLDRYINLPSNFDVSMCDYVGFFACNLNEFENIKFKEGAEISFGERQPYSKMEFPEILDLSMIAKVLFDECDLSKVKKLKFRDGANVEFYNNTDLPEVLDVSMCSKVVFNNCEFNNVEELKLGEVTDVVFRFAKNLPIKNNECINLSGIKFGKDTKLSFENVKWVSFSKSSFPEVLDFSGVDEVGFLSCDFSNVKEMKFKEGAKLTITGNIPEDFDFSLFGDVTFADCDLTNLKKLKFRDGARVRFIEDVHCDKLLDVSNCGEVYFGKTRIGREEDEEGILYDMPYLKKIKFKNISQMKKSGIARDYRKFVFKESSFGETARKIAGILGGMDKD